MWPRFGLVSPNEGRGEVSLCGGVTCLPIGYDARALGGASPGVVVVVHDVFIFAADAGPDSRG